MISKTLLLAFILLLEPITATFAFQPEPDYQRLASAIKRAENSLSHPYGIMTKYKHTSPRQACINTCKHAYKDWLTLLEREARPARLATLGSPSDGFMAFLANRYAPVKGATNDPAHLNKNWLKNVRFYYRKSFKYHQYQTHRNLMVLDPQIGKLVG